MAKVCILSTVNIKHMTMVSIYTEFLELNHIPYDIIYIDKYHSYEEIQAEHIYRYEITIERKWPKIVKALKYLSFRKYALNILKTNQYDFVITWNALTLFMFAHELSTFYKKEYCVNIRDILPRYNQLLNTGIATVVKNAAFCTVSSPGFVNHLPKAEYLHIHSMNTKILEKCQPHTSLKNRNGKINIVYIGYMCYYNYCKRFIDELKNDERFHLYFYGQGSSVIENYAKERNIGNVTCIGRFEAEETASLIQKADIIFNLYGTENINLREALSIKLYYAIYLQVPILVFKDTYMSNIAEDCGIGISIGTDEFSSLADNLYNAYYDLNFELIKKRCQNYRKIIEINKQELYSRISCFIEVERHANDTAKN